MAEARRRIQDYDDANRNYLMVLREHFLDRPMGGRVLVTHVDATHKGNVSRFFNHSCTPTLSVHPIRNSFVPVVGLFASRNIAAGEELTFHYGGGGDYSNENCHMRHHPATATIAEPFDDEQIPPSKKVAAASHEVAAASGRRCYCGTAMCAGYLPRHDI